MKPQLKTFMPPIPGINPIDAILAKDRAEEDEECKSLIHQLEKPKMQAWDKVQGKIIEVEEVLEGEEKKGGIKLGQVQAGYDPEKGKYVQPRTAADMFRMRGQCCSLCHRCGKRIKAEFYLRHVRRCRG